MPTPAPLPPAARPLLLLAPHLEYPARNGADVTHVELARSLSHALPRVDVVAARDVVRYVGGEEVDRRAYASGMRTRAVAALRTAALGTHYLLEKFVTPAFRREASLRLADDGYGTVLHSFLTTAALADLPDPDRRHVVWTHNDEFKWFEDLRRQARDPLARRVASVSHRWIGRFMERHERDLLLLHVTEEDREGWARHFPHHRARVVPIGVALRPEAAPPKPAGAPVRLLFVGALGIRMNLDALTHFAERFWPALRERFGGDLSMTAAGSRPLPGVRALCEREGWALRADVAEDELDGLYEAATFSVLPFAYATGAKLKLLKSLAYGVPVLATSAVQAQEDFAAPPSLLSDDPAAWAAHVERVRASGIPADARGRLRGLVEAHSWDASARLIVDALADA